ncbi:hypothetical protein SDC9_196303 [bioreactor metagenome]|uniref:Uncharacterized protein n=1 Tax=bioreactor metagenome TaxID=1076179 RepID=A0A645IBG9_9ZZZZ
MDNLLFRALRIFRFQRLNSYPGSGLCSRAHGLDCVRLVRFNRDNATAHPCCLENQLQAADDTLRRFQHEPVVGGQIRLAFRAVKDDRVRMLAFRNG